MKKIKMTVEGSNKRNTIVKIDGTVETTNVMKILLYALTNVISVAAGSSNEKLDIYKTAAINEINKI